MSALEFAVFWHLLRFDRFTKALVIEAVHRSTGASQVAVENTSHTTLSQT